MTWLDNLLAERGQEFIPISKWDPSLEALCDGLPCDEAQVLREERAGILEFEGGMARSNAEALAGLMLQGTAI